MNTVTIPKSVTRGEELVIIPRKEYEMFVHAETPKKSPTDLAIDEGLQDIREGRISPPFHSAKAATQYLHRKTKQLN